MAPVELSVKWLSNYSISLMPWHPLADSKTFGPTFIYLQYHHLRFFGKWIAGQKGLRLYSIKDCRLQKGLHEQPYTNQESTIILSGRLLGRQDVAVMLPRIH
jgi:hypothetical protein